MFKWYTWMRADSLKANLKIWSSLQASRLRRYYSYTECVVPANVKTPWSMYFEILDDRVWPFEIIIRCTTLNAEYQKDLMQATHA